MTIFMEILRLCRFSIKSGHLPVMLDSSAILPTVSMEIVWRQYREESDNFYGDFTAELAWRLSGENMVNKITRQSLY